MEILGTIKYNITPNYFVIVEAAPTSDLAHPDYHDVWEPPQENPRTYNITVPTYEPHWVVFYESIDGVTKGDVISSSFTQSALPNISFDTIAALKDFNSAMFMASLFNSSLQYVPVLGYYAKGDGGGGNFMWDAASTLPDNGGTIIQPTGVAVGRWIRVMESGSVNVKIFGAKGDGAFNDLPAINAVIAAGYNRLSFPKGNYLLPNGNSITGDLSNLKFSGEDKASVLIKTGAGPVTPFISGGGDNISISNLTFTAPNVANTDANVFGFLEINRGNNLTISECTFIDGIRGIWLRCGADQTLSNVTIQNNILTDLRDGIYVGASQESVTGDLLFNVKITSNTITQGKGTDETDGGDGIKLIKKCNNLIISNNYISGFIRDAIDMFAGGEKTIINGNILADSGVKGLDIKAIVDEFPISIWGYNGHNLVITNNIIENNTTAVSIARNVNVDTDYNYFIDVSHNQIINNTQTAVQLYGKHIKIADNFFMGNGTATAGAYHVIQCGDDTIERSSQFCDIFNNKFVNNGSDTTSPYAVRIGLGCQDINIIGNTIANDANLPNPYQKNGVYVNTTTQRIKWRNNNVAGVTGIPFTFITGSEVDTDFVSGSAQGFTLQNISDTGNKTTNAVDLVQVELANGLRNIIYPKGGFYLNNASSGVTGIIKLTMPFGWNNTIVDIRITGNNYNSGTGQHFEIKLTGMNNSATNWVSTSALIIGNNSFSDLVRLGYDGANCCILIGDTTTSWSRIKIIIDSICVSYTGGAAGWDINWTSSLITTTTGITNIITPALTKLPAATNYLIVNTSIVSTAITTAYMDTTYPALPLLNSVYFTNLSDDATHVAVITKLAASSYGALSMSKLT